MTSAIAFPIAVGRAFRSMQMPMPTGLDVPGVICSCWDGTMKTFGEHHRLDSGIFSLCVLFPATEHRSPTGAGRLVRAISNSAEITRERQDHADAGPG